VRRAALLGAALLATALAWPAGALAHGFVGRQDLPIPRWLFAWGAATVLVVSFVALAALWPRPRMQELRERTLTRLPTLLDPLCGALGVFWFGLIVYAGLAGSKIETANLAPTAVYVLFWVGIPFASLLFGDVFRAFNPWRAIARFFAWIAGRVTRPGSLPEPLEYPERVGRWPAAFGIFAFAWLELAYVERNDPQKLAILALVYLAVQLIGMSLYGIERWLQRADAFGVYFGLYGRLSPLHWRRGSVSVRWPLEGVVQLDTVAGTVALLCVAIGTTSFDGLTQGPLWNDHAPDVQRWFIDHLGTSARVGQELTYTLGLLLMIGVISGLYRLGVTGMHGVGERYATDDLARRFVHTLVPIALAYVVAHYFSFFVYEGQRTGYLISDPLGEGSDLFGTAKATVDYGVISATGIWYVQVGALVLGHVSGLVLAHDRALAIYRSPRDATRSQYWMLAVMVAFTSLGLWLLSASSI
jgi:hypothetical protein